MGGAASTDAGNSIPEIAAALSLEPLEPPDVSALLDDASARDEARRLHELSRQIIGGSELTIEIGNVRPGSNPDMADALARVLQRSNSTGRITPKVRSATTSPQSDKQFRPGTPRTASDSVRGSLFKSPRGTLLPRLSSLRESAVKQVKGVAQTNYSSLDGSAQGKRHRLASATSFCVVLDESEGIGASVALQSALKTVVQVFVSDDLSSANDINTNAGAAYAGQVNIGGRVYFVLSRDDVLDFAHLKRPEVPLIETPGRERVCVVKFGKSSGETTSEAMANAIARRIGVRLPSVALVRNDLADCRSVAELSSEGSATGYACLWGALRRLLHDGLHLDDVEKDTPVRREDFIAAESLLEDLERSTCFLAQEFVRGENFDAKNLLDCFPAPSFSVRTTSTASHSYTNQVEGAAVDKSISARFSIQQIGQDLGRVWTADLLLRNADRLIDRDLQWRGNLTNLLLAVNRNHGGSDTEGVTLWAIDTTLCRRPPRLALRSDATKLLHSLGSALSPCPTVALAKLQELIGLDMSSGDTSLSPHGIDGSSLESKLVDLLNGFQKGVRSGLRTIVRDVLPELQLRHTVLIKSFEEFFVQASQLAVSPSGDNPNLRIMKPSLRDVRDPGKSKTEFDTKSRPNTARVRDVSRALHAGNVQRLVLHTLPCQVEEQEAANSNEVSQSCTGEHKTDRQLQRLVRSFEDKLGAALWKGVNEGLGTALKTQPMTFGFTLEAELTDRCGAKSTYQGLLFSGAYEEMVRLEHILSRGKLMEEVAELSDDLESDILDPSHIFDIFKTRVDGLDHRDRGKLPVTPTHLTSPLPPFSEDVGPSVLRLSQCRTCCNEIVAEDTKPFALSPVNPRCTHSDSKGFQASDVGRIQLSPRLGVGHITLSCPVETSPSKLSPRKFSSPTSRLSPRLSPVSILRTPRSSVLSIDIYSSSPRSMALPLTPPAPLDCVSKCDSVDSPTSGDLVMSSLIINPNDSVRSPRLSPWISRGEIIAIETDFSSCTIGSVPAGGTATAAHTLLSLHKTGLGGHVAPWATTRPGYLTPVLFSETPNQRELLLRGRKSLPDSHEADMIHCKEDESVPVTRHGSIGPEYRNGIL